MATKETPKSLFVFPLSLRLHPVLCTTWPPPKVGS